MLESQTTPILKTAETAADLLRLLFELGKSTNKNFSIGYLAKQAVIPSRGLVSDYLSGRRRPAPRYWEGLAKAFLLRGISREVFLAILRRDAAANDGEKATLTASLTRLRKALSASPSILPRRARGAMLFLELFSAFGLFRNTPTREDLRQHFGPAYQLELDLLLHLLQTQNIIALVDDHYEVLQDSFKLVDSEDRYSHIEMLKASMTDARNHIDRWFHERELSFFTAGVVSVREDKYKEFVAAIKDAIVKAHTDIESSDANMLVRFNLQMYPSPFSPPLN